MWLRKLHPKFSKLAPAELKAALLADMFLELGDLNGEEIKQVKTQSELLGFQVVVME